MIFFSSQKNKEMEIKNKQQHYPYPICFFPSLPTCCLNFCLLLEHFQTKFFGLYQLIFQSREAGINLTFQEVQNKRFHSFQSPILKKMKAGLFTCSAALKTKTKVSCCHSFILKNNTCEMQVSNWVTKVGQGNIKENKNRHNFIP